MESKAFKFNLHGTLHGSLCSNKPLSCNLVKVSKGMKTFFKVCI